MSLDQTLIQSVLLIFRPFLNGHQMALHINNFLLFPLDQDSQFVNFSLKSAVLISQAPYFMA